jgi:poly(A) polymerase
MSGASPDGRTDRRLSETGWLAHGPVAKLLALLARDGEEARVVGGAVRRALLGEAIDEVDVATTALPDEVIRRSAAAGFKAVPTGIEHGTVTVVIEGTPIEATTLRVDVETYGRKAAVRFGRDWRVDAERRDFTMNALSADREGAIYDYVGGLADLEARRVRFIGDPRIRISEDYLRILRFFRFHAVYGRGPLDPAGLNACASERAGLALLSRERVRMELMKLLVAPGAAPVLEAMADYGLLVPIIGGVPNPAYFRRMTDIDAALGQAPDFIRRLGALAVLVEEDAERLRVGLRLANSEFERLQAMPGSPRMGPDIGERAARAALYRLGATVFTDRVRLAWVHAGAASDDPQWTVLANLPQRWSPAVFPLKAADFIARGVPKGPALGAAMREAEEAWIAADFTTDAAQLEAIAEAAAQEHLSAR